MTKVKICGITNLSDAEHAAASGADALGFNFYRGTKRYVPAHKAEAIAQQLPAAVMKVGVFVNGTLNEILKTAFVAELDAIQLHGDETPEFVAELRKETDAMVIKAFRTEADIDLNEITRYAVDAILLDSFSAKERGGTGIRIDLSIAAKVSALSNQFFLAGGLTPDNVAEAIRAVKPYAVDVASGVESSPGRKDPAKVEAFIRAVRRTANS